MGPRPRRTRAFLSIMLSVVLSLAMVPRSALADSAASTDTFPAVTMQADADGTITAGSDWTLDGSVLRHGHERIVT